MEGKLIKKRILYIVPYSPISSSDGPQGPKNFTKSILSFVTDEYSVDLVVLTSDDSSSLKVSLYEKFKGIDNLYIIKREVGWRKTLRGLCWLSLLYPASLGKYYSRELVRFLCKNDAKYDLVHFDYFYLVQYRRYFSANIFTVLTCHDAYSLFNYRAMKSASGLLDKFSRFLRYKFFLKLEKNYYSQFSKVVTISSVDAKYLEDNAKQFNVDWIPCSVDSKFLKIARMENNVKMMDKPELVCVLPPTTHSWLVYEAVWFHEKGIVELIKKIGPDIRIIFWGKSSKYIKEHSKLSELPVNVEYIEYVDDLEKFLTQSNRIFIYLLKVGAGLHTKLLEIMACGHAVVGYDEIMSGFIGSNERDFISVSCNEGLVEAVSELFIDSKRRYQMGKAAKKNILSEYSHEKMSDAVRDIYRQPSYSE